MKLSTLLFTPLMILAALIFLLADRLNTPRMSGAIDSPLIGKALPDLGIQNPSHAPFMVNFFASWCTPCAVEHPVLMQMKKDGIPIIGIVFKDTPEAVSAWLKNKGNPYTAILYDDGNGAGIAMGITGVPESFAVDADHIVRARVQGPLEDPGVMKTFMKVLKP